MKCIKQYSILFLLLVLFVGLYGSLWGETTPPTYSELLISSTEIWKSWNSLAVNSQVTLLDMKEAWPDLVQAVATWGLKFEVFEKTFNQRLETSAQNMDKFNQDFSTSLTELTVLRNQYDRLLSLVETTRTSFTNIEEEVNLMKKRTNTGLVLSIIAALIAAGKVAYDIYQDIK